jgi:hypothetical protein
MINVDITPFGRQMMMSLFGVLKYQAIAKDKMIQNLQKELQQINMAEEQHELWNDISFSATIRSIDKRFKSSKEFMESGVATNLKYKKTTTDDDKRFIYIANQNMLKARTRYLNSVSNHNKILADQKIRATFKLADLQKVMR